MGHGDHWEAIGSDYDHTFGTLLPEVAAKGKPVGESGFDKPVEGGGSRPEKVFAITYPDTPLRYLVLIETDSSEPKPSNVVCSAYPYCGEGLTNRVLIEELSPGRNPIEGVLAGITRGGASVSFFDSDFYKNRLRYHPGKAYDFSIAGLAYSLQKATQQSITITEGPEIEYERQRLLKLNPNADVSQVNSVELSVAELRYLIPCGDIADDAEVRTVVEDVGYFEAQGIGFYRLRAVLMDPEGIPFEGYIYAAERALKGYRPRKGDAVEGFLWLQGRLVSDQEFDPASEEGQESNGNPYPNLSRKAAATEDDFASLHIGLQSLGRTLENWNFEVAEYSNPDKSLDIPVFRIAKDGRQTNVWARAFIAGQDPEPLFTPEETARFSEESKLKGRDVAFVIVRCKDIGKGYTLGFTGLDSLKHSANLGTLSYISKDSRPSQSA